MQTWIALLRGVNVGGNNILPMKCLRELLGELGFEDARTYIQSGNCVFRAEGMDAAAIAESLSGAIGRQFGFRPAVLVLKREELDAALAGNPFSSDAIDPKTVHLFFLAEPVKLTNRQAMRALLTDADNFALIGNIFYLHTPGGFGRCKLADRLGKFLPVEMTARNLRSVRKIAELAQAPG